jgi:hypothetical protein
MLFVYRAITVYGQAFQPALLRIGNLRAVPRPLAATKGISVDFFSSGYLDVSVPQVRFAAPMYSVQDGQVNLAGFPHSDIRGSGLVCKLPAAFRMLQRPSSPLTA